MRYYKVHYLDCLAPLFALAVFTSFGCTVAIEPISRSFGSHHVQSGRQQQQQQHHQQQQQQQQQVNSRRLGSFQKSLMIGSLCTTKEASSGVCRSVQNCSFVIENFYRVQWTVCAWEGHVPVVCCPGKRTSDDNVLGITPSFLTSGTSRRPGSSQPTALGESNDMLEDVQNEDNGGIDDEHQSDGSVDDVVHMPLSSGSSASLPWRPSFAPGVQPTPILFAGESGRPSKPSQFFSIKHANGTQLFSVRTPDKLSSSLKKQRCGVPSYNINNDHRKRPVRRLRQNGKFLELDRGTSSIVGGTEAAIGSFPWMAAIFKTTRIGNGFRHSFLCGGSILGPYYVITAAHCFNRYDDPMIFSVRVGDQDLRSATDIGINPEDIAVQKVIMHPDYQPPQVYNDVALLRLKRNLSLDSGYLLPICLPDPQKMAEINLTDVEGTVIGFGSTQLVGKASSGALHQVALPIVDNDLCEESYNQVLGLSVYFPNGITKHLLCAGHEDGGKDACQGDSGGPLMMFDDEGRWNLIGIVSVGRGCAEPGFPGLYTRMEHYVSWVHNVTAT